MSDVKIEFVGYSHIKVECENSIFMEIRDYYAFEMDGYKFNPKYKYGGWDGKIRLMSTEGLLPIGLLSNLVAYCASNDLTCDVDSRLNPIHQMTRTEFDEWLDGLEIYAGENRIKPHWYQADAVFEAINSNRRTLNLPTSAGKSLISAIINRWYIERYEGKILVIVPTTALVQQMIDDYSDYRIISRGMCHGIQAGTRKDSADALVYVSTWQSACKQPREWFQQFGMLNVDECHLSTGLQISKIVANMDHTIFKFGMSGSLKDGKANIMQYIGMFGTVYKPVSTRQLIDDGQVSKLKINSIFLRYPDQDVTLTRGIPYPDEITHITNHTKRNVWICKLALKLAAKDENVVLFFKHIKHGKRLFEALKAKHGEDKVVFISGEVKTEARVEMKGIAENSTGLIIVASYGVMSTGISIKNLHHLIFAHPVKSAVIVLQSLGRVIRKHDSKDTAQLWDIVDDICAKPKSSNSKKKYVHLNYAYKHGLERIDIYNRELHDYSIKEVIIKEML